MDCVTTDDDGRRRTTTNDDIAIADFIASHRTREDDVTYDTRRFSDVDSAHTFIHSFIRKRRIIVGTLARDLGWDSNATTAPHATTVPCVSSTQRVRESYATHAHAHAHRRRRTRGA